jgi:hypothetical protein
MYPTYYDWQVEISRLQCKKKNPGEEEEEEEELNWQHDDDDDSLKNDPATLGTVDTARGKTSENSQYGGGGGSGSGGSGSSSSNSRIPSKEPLLTVQWNWPVYQVALFLQAQSSSTLPLLQEEEEPNPVVTMKYAATFHPRHQKMSSRGRFS